MAIKLEGAVDRYTVAHGMVGYILGVWGAPWPVALGGSLIFEHVEDRLKEMFPAIFPEAKPDTRGNTIVDTLAWMGGYMAAQPVKSPARIWRRFERR